MKCLRRSIRRWSILFALAIPCLMTSSIRAQEDATGIVDTIAQKFGMSDLSTIEELRFTYCAKSPEGKVRRQWQWFPCTDNVIFTGKDPHGKNGTISYSRKALADLRKEAVAHIVDAWFVNDLYWLLFPYFLKTDPQKRMTRNSAAVMPLSGEWGTCITVEYYRPDDRRPGSRFDVFVDSTFRIKEWVVYPYESRRIVAANQWKSYRHVGPFVLSLDRPSQNRKSVTVKFSDVSIRMTNQ